MTARFSLWLSFALGLLAVGVPCWLAPCDMLNLHNALPGPGLIVIASLLGFACACVGDIVDALIGLLKERLDARQGT